MYVDITPIPARLSGENIMSVRKWSREMRRLRLAVYPSQANFLLFQGPEDLKERCREKKILIRDCRNYRGLSAGWFRTAVKLHEENTVLIHTLEEIL